MSHEAKIAPRVIHVAKQIVENPIDFITNHRDLPHQSHMQDKPLGILFHDIEHTYWSAAMPLTKKYSDEQLQHVANFLGFGSSDQGYLAHCLLVAYFARPADYWNTKLLTSTVETEQTLDTIASLVVDRMSQFVTCVSKYMMEEETTSDEGKKQKSADTVGKLVDMLIHTEPHYKSNGRKNITHFLIYAANARRYNPANAHEEHVSHEIMESENRRLEKRADKATFLLHFLESIQYPLPRYQRWIESGDRNAANLLLHITYDDFRQIPALHDTSPDDPIDVQSLLIEKDTFTLTKEKLRSQLGRMTQELTIQTISCPNSKYRAYYHLLTKQLIEEQQSEGMVSHVLPLPDHQALLLIRKQDVNEETQRVYSVQIGLALQRFLKERNERTMPAEVFDALYIGNEIQAWNNWEEKKEELRTKIVSGINAIGKRGVKINLRRIEDQSIAALGITSMTIKKQLSANGTPLAYDVQFTILGRPVHVTFDTNFQLVEHTLPKHSEAFFTSLLYAYIAIFKNPEDQEEIEIDAPSKKLKSPYEPEEKMSTVPIPRYAWHPARLVKLSAGYKSHKLEVGKPFHKAVSQDIYDRTALLCKSDFGADLVTLNTYFLQAQASEQDIRAIPKEFHTLMHTLLARRTSYDMRVKERGIFCELGYIEEGAFEGAHPVPITCKGAAQLLLRKSNGSSVAPSLQNEES